ncbi:uncharacterized protein VP01_3659g1 [Puccinia sorghi]|uniref:DUF659 domain-containing protein n=1 Tax=Puccinia sorghi TaxID=27349 RepID=A0A0L6UV89_9BASI|nr:uncharacterized protein VP01_3659g1 [Puccinia sorghi]
MNSVSPGAYSHKVHQYSREVREQYLTLYKTKPIKYQAKLYIRTQVGVGTGQNSPVAGLAPEPYPRLMVHPGPRSTDIPGSWVTESGCLRFLTTRNIHAPWGHWDTDIPASLTPAVGYMIQECRGSQGICLPLISWSSDLKINYRPQPTLTSIPPFKLNSEMNKVKCLAPDRKKGGEPCGTLLTQEATSSTKFMSEQLRRVHLILPPTVACRALCIFFSYFFTIIYHALIQILQPILNFQILREAIGYLVAKANLPFSILERPFFNNLLQLLNPHTASMEFGRKTIRNTRVNFADLLVDTLDKLELSDKFISITTDNAFSNSSQLLGCMAHVINLFAHDGISVFGTDNRMDLANLVNEPGQYINLHTVVSRIHGLATYVRGSPQRREGFEAFVDFINNVRRWNSTYDMLNRALKLQKVCSTYCGSESTDKVSRFSLLNTKWDKVAQMVSFLEPLDNVTQILCRSKFPTLSMGLPIYISLIKIYITFERNTTCFQLIPAAEKMIEKLKKDLVWALEKPALCSMILNPRIKLRHLEKNQSFLAQAFDRIKKECWFSPAFKPTSLEKPHLQMILVLKLTTH